MLKEQIRKQWEGAAPGWARWEDTVATWMAPATEHMLDMAGVANGARVLDLACGAGSQTLQAASRVGPQGSVLAVDIAETMLKHVMKNARAAGLSNVATLSSAAEDLNLDEDSFDAGFLPPGLDALSRPGGCAQGHPARLATWWENSTGGLFHAEANSFMAQPLQVLLRHGARRRQDRGSREFLL